MKKIEITKEMLTDIMRIAYYEGAQECMRKYILKRLQNEFWSVEHRKCSLKDYAAEAYKIDIDEIMSNLVEEDNL